MNERQLHEGDAADALAALGNRTRLRVYRLLVRAGDEGLTVGEIQSRLSIAASTLAHHLATLAKAGLIDQERQGRETLCRAHYARVDALVGYLTENCCAGFAADAGEDAA